MKAPACFNVFTQKFDATLTGSFAPIDPIEAIKANTAGIPLTTVSGSAIAGTRTSSTRFTRTSGVWIQEVILPLSGVTASGGYTTFYPGETVTESSSSSTGVVIEASTTELRLKTISAAFTGGLTLTGGTSGVTATGGTAVNVVTPLRGKLIFSHASGTLTAGTVLRVKSNTATYLDVENSLHATGTAIILCDNEAAMRDAMDISYGS